MGTLTTQQKIERLERELADLRDKDRIEREEASKRKETERRADFEKLKKCFAGLQQKVRREDCSRSRTEY